MERSPPEPALPHALAVEKPVLDFANKLLQLLAGGVDEQGSRLAEYRPLHPQLRADGCRGPQRAGKAQHPRDAKDHFLLLSGHGGTRRPLRDAAFSTAVTSSASAGHTAEPPARSPAPSQPRRRGEPSPRDRPQPPPPGTRRLKDAAEVYFFPDPFCTAPARTPMRLSKLGNSAVCGVFQCILRVT